MEEIGGENEQGKDGKIKNAPGKHLEKSGEGRGKKLKKQ